MRQREGGIRTRAPLKVDEGAARRVAADFLDQSRPATPSLVRAAYRQLVVQTDELLHHLLGRRWPTLRLASTELETPYASDDELIDSVRLTDVLELPRADRQRRHSLLTCEPGGEHDRIRAVHDLMGHVLPRYGFDRDGEFSAWHLQHRQYRGLARWALATELHAHHSVRWTTGELAEPRATLIAPRLLSSSLSAATAVTRPPTASRSLSQNRGLSGPHSQPPSPLRPSSGHVVETGALRTAWDRASSGHRRAALRSTTATR